MALCTPQICRLMQLPNEYYEGIELIRRHTITMGNTSHNELKFVEYSYNCLFYSFG